MKNLKIKLALCSVAAIAISACTHNNSLSMAQKNINISTKSFDGKNVGLDLSQQADVVTGHMGGNKFNFDNSKTTVKSFFEAALKDKAKSVKEGKGDITLKPRLDIDIVNDYFSAGCLARFEITMLNAKGEQIKAVHKDFKKSYFNSGFGHPEKDACNEAATQAMTIALQSL